MTKDEFLARMERALQPLAPHERIDVLGDYAEHFRAGEESGKSDDEIARTLGDPEALARIYLEQKSGDAPPQSAFDPPPAAPPGPPAPERSVYVPEWGAPPQAGAGAAAAVPAGYASPAAPDAGNQAVATLLVILFNLIVGVPIICGVGGAALAVPGMALGFLAAAISLFVIAAALMIRPLVGGAVICFGLACLALSVLLSVATAALARLVARVLTRYVRFCVRICREGRWPG